MEAVVGPVLFSYQHLGLWCAMRHIVMFCEGNRLGWRPGERNVNLVLRLNVFFCPVAIVKWNVGRQSGSSRTIAEGTATVNIDDDNSGYQRRDLQHVVKD